MANKRHNFHDLSDEDEDDFQQSSSNFKEDSRSKQISKKHRRIEQAEDEDVSSASHSDTEDEDSPTASASSKAVKVKSVDTKQLEALRRKAKKTGVIYISRVPPYMKPGVLRNLLTPYGEIGRLFLTPEPTPIYQKRVRSGGNKRRSFLDGWVEFTSKKKAKACVELLNGNIVGGKKGGFYHDDLWNMKYLKGFKWSNLIEQVQMEQKMQEGQMRAELQQEERERKSFIENLHRTKAERGMKAKRLKQAQAKGLQPEDGSKQSDMASADEVHRKARFHQSPENHKDSQQQKSHQTASGEHSKTLQDLLF